MKGRRWVLLGVSVIAGLGILAPIARAAGVTFDQRIVNGTVDFGDWVQYELSGTGCAGKPVRAVVHGPGTKDAVSAVGTASPACQGTVRVPTENEVRTVTGWTTGAPVAISLVSGDQSLPLRYQRVDVDRGTAAAGAPTVVRYGDMAPEDRDPRAEASDDAMAMNIGDVVGLGRVNLRGIYSISLRVCVTSDKPHLTPSLVELRAGDDFANAPSIIGRVDVADDVNNSNKSNFGWPNCWQLQPWPIINPPSVAEPQLWLAMVGTAGTVDISYVDFNGTGVAKKADAWEPDPAGMGAIPVVGTDHQTWVDGVDGWDHSANCTVDPSDDSVHAVHSSSPANVAPLATFGFGQTEEGCTLTYKPPVQNILLKFQYRLQDFEDNGAIYINGKEIQMREAGEWMTGGVQGTTLPQALTNFATNDPNLNAVTGYPAQRIKSNTFPAWSEIEILQLGSRYLVRINGRTVTDCSNDVDDAYVDCIPEPTGPYQFRVQTQPNFSYHYGVGYRMDTGPNNPTTDDPSNWGNISFRNFRMLSCGDPSKPNPACMSIPGVNG